MDEQQLKPVVCILNPDDIYWIQEKQTNLPNPSVNLLTPYQAKELRGSQGVVFPEIRENKVFMLDPFVEKRYIVRTESTDADIVEKRINAIEVIVSLLGGTKFKAISARKSDLDNETHIGAGVNVKVNDAIFGISADTKVDKDSKEYKEKCVTVMAEFKGKYSKKNYYLAKEVAKQYGLSDDPKIMSLLETRNPDNPNYIKKKTYRVNTSSDLKRNLGVAGRLKTAVKNTVKVDLDVNVETSHDERYMDSFEFEVEFSPIKRWIKLAIGGAITALAAALVIALL